MTASRPAQFSRRHFLTTAAALGAVGASGRAIASPAIEDARLLLGGSLASIPGQFGTLAAGPLSRAMDLETPIRLQPDLGQDGVTAANLFDSTETLDGATAIAVPGPTLLASLIGDSRVHYDFGRWTPLMVARAATVVVGRTPPKRGLRMRIEGLFQNHSVRLAMSHPLGAELSTLLGLTLLGMRPTPVTGFTSTQQALDALRDGQVDAIQLSPPTLTTPLSDVLKNLPPGTSALYQSGDVVDLRNEQVPNFLEAYQQLRHRIPEGPLYQAWQGVTASTDTALTVALPMLTPPAVVAQWRRAFESVMTDSGIRQWASLNHFTLAAGNNAAPLLSRATPPLGATLALRRWIAINTPRWRLGQETRGLM